MDWEKLDKTIDLQGLQEDIENAEDYPVIPDGKYDVKLDESELTTSKTEKPMSKITFKIIDGDYKGMSIFYYQVLEKPFAFKVLFKVINALDDSEHRRFEGFAALDEVLKNLPDVCDPYGYGLEIKTNTKGFRSYEILDVFESK